VSGSCAFSASNVSDRRAATIPSSLLMKTDSTRSERSRRRPYVPLFQRVAVMNAVLLIAAVAVAIGLLAPEKISSFEVDKEVIALVIALGLVVLANVYLLRRVISPLQALAELARRVDLANPGERMPGAEPTSEAGELALTFNEMLDRMEAERRDATGRVLAGQEAERLRIAQELHDQVGQQLTAVLLVLSRVYSRAPAELQGEVLEVQAAVRSGLEDVRRISIELRPEALDDLGLESALAVLCDRFAERTGLAVHQQIADDLPLLAPETELVVYRVAQEALTNVARHSGSDQADMMLDSADGLITLAVRDRGHGIGNGEQDPGGGIRGMRERAALIGARLRIGPNPSGAGCEVRLDIPRNGTR
jgi:two-component system, NarL family, sensor histidine kinase UhpB